MRIITSCYLEKTTRSSLAVFISGALYGMLVDQVNARFKTTILSSVKDGSHGGSTRYKCTAECFVAAPRPLPPNHHRPSRRLAARLEWFP